MRLRDAAYLDIEGRADDVFTYGGGVVVHPLVFRSRIGHERNLLEYQVTQTASGADIRLRTLRPVNTDAVAASLEHDLVGLGVSPARVSVHITESLDRRQSAS